MNEPADGGHLNDRDRDAFYAAIDEFRQNLKEMAITFGMMRDEVKEHSFWIKQHIQETEKREARYLDDKAKTDKEIKSFRTWMNDVNRPFLWLGKLSALAALAILIFELWKHFKGG